MVYNQKYFSLVTTKNLNWGMLTKNLITFKRWENPILGVVGGFTKNQYKRIIA